MCSAGGKLKNKKIYVHVLRLSMQCILQLSMSLARKRSIGGIRVLYLLFLSVLSMLIMCLFLFVCV